MAVTATRIEKDTMGEMTVPADALYGASTQRAVENFPISGRPVPAAVIHAYGHLKAACAHVNHALGRLNLARHDSIVQAALDIAAGKHDRHFPIDVFQTGSGTSTNMNANEVIANLVCVARGKPIGSSKDPAYIGDAKTGEGVHPNDHVNMGQSSNDTFPTAIHIGAALNIRDHLIPALEKTAAALEKHARQWDRIIKIGRTHLMDATPIRLGQEFSGYAAQMRHAERRARQAIDALAELPIGGTAVGTGINAHEDFGRMVCERLARQLNVPFREARNHFEAQHAKDGLVEASGLIATIAISLSKIASDIRLMGSGPRCGIGELKLPATQPGSSIMPGKVNPVICEAAIMVCCQVLANDHAVKLSGLGGVGSILDLNVAMPVLADNILESVHLLARACHVFTDKCLLGLEPNEARCRELIEGSLAMCTSLVPVIGYDRSAAIAKQAYAEGKTVRQLSVELLVEKEKRLSQKELDALLDPSSMTVPGGEGSAGG
ncbi:MAG: class II fumarate hydratase [Phycisphaerales bacterium]|nr:class II fumarate hydratase [Phycisphaerales bacterium]